MSSLLSAPKSSQLEPTQPSSRARRSNRVSPARRDNVFIPTSPDSRRSLYLPDEEEGTEDDPEEDVLESRSGERSHTPTRPPAP